MNKTFLIHPFLEPTINKYLLVCSISGKQSVKAQRLRSIIDELLLLYFDS
ncbi:MULTISPECIES: hypothetical protein [Bacillaceae]|nr:MULTISPECIES: hypothetical protein [Bacillaceae]MCM3164713.1 hypothetical protein [Metabacillus litoralis]UGB33606.1 hypothetical protein LPC09_27110 [Metabacillus sp. B2-18]